MTVLVMMTARAPDGALVVAMGMASATRYSVKASITLVDVIVGDLRVGHQPEFPVAGEENTALLGETQQGGRISWVRRRNTMLVCTSPN